jgi:hypothetical protein
MTYKLQGWEYYCLELTKYPPYHLSVGREARKDSLMVPRASSREGFTVPLNGHPSSHLTLTNQTHDKAYSPQIKCFIIALRPTNVFITNI